MLDKAEIEKLEQARVDAMLAADVKSIDGMMFDDAVYIHSAGAVDTKQVFMDRLSSGDLDYHSIDMAIDTVAIVGATALVVGKKEISLHRGGIPVELHLRYSAIWVEDATGDPRMLSFQATLIPPKAAV